MGRGKEKKGFTLIEVMISLALIGIIAAICLPLFFRSFKGIISCGKRTKSLFKAQETIEAKINDGVIDDTEKIKNIQIVLYSPDKITTITSKIIRGKVITERTDDNQAALSTFIPTDYDPSN